MVDKLVDLYLAEMMNLHMKSQGVPELVKTVKKNGTHEDFNNDVMNNYDKIDFDRRWYHFRTKLGAPLSLDELVETTPEALADAEAFFKDNEKEYIILRREFLDTLNSADREIYIMLENECTQAEIAERLLAKISVIKLLVVFDFNSTPNLKPLGNLKTANSTARIFRHFTTTLL